MRGENLAFTDLTYTALTPAIAQLVYKKDNCRIPTGNHHYRTSDYHNSLEGLGKFALAASLGMTLGGGITYECTYTLFLNFSETLTPKIFKHYSEGKYIDLFEGPGTNTFKMTIDTGPVP